MVAVNANNGIEFRPYINKELRRVILKLIILKKVERGRTYSYALIKEISRNRHIGSLMNKPSEIKNEVYNQVNALEKRGMIKTEAVIEGGRLKKYYKLTSKGSYAINFIEKSFEDAKKNIIKLLK